MPKFEYITCILDYKNESTWEFLEKINKLGENRWEVTIILPNLLPNFNQILLKREKQGTKDL